METIPGFAKVNQGSPVNIAARGFAFQTLGLAATRTMAMN
ncbi:hypothetical protein MGA3_17024 [Bacillus methanolicus MGA3]|nr:hypothetical protein MGA3_17024 [Bacillus methanolicus MGA3]